MDANGGAVDRARSSFAHQTTDLAWIPENAKSDLLGGCLGNEMGLGMFMTIRSGVQLFTLLSPLRRSKCEIYLPAVEAL